MGLAGVQQIRQIGQVLLEKDLITQQQIEFALAEQKKRGGRQLLGEIITELGLCSEEQVAEALADAYGVPFARLTPKLLDPKISEILPREYRKKNNVLPLFKVDGVLTVAVAEPSNVYLIEEIGRLTESAVQIVAATAGSIRAIHEQYVPDAEVFIINELMVEAKDAGMTAVDPGAPHVADLESMVADSPVIKLVNYVIFAAAQDGASDIHIEPQERALRVRFRIDGQLVEKLNPPHQMHPAIASRIKIMAGLDISERRLPQDGGIRIMVEGRPVDLRVSTMPNKFGEKVVIRIIDKQKVLVDLVKLGLPDSLLARFKVQIHRPYGLILVTGPTGSGKSTTLYSVLSEINRSAVNICTVEDPVEFNLPGVNQFQTNERIGLTFASVLRSLLRQDPDIIMIGEIRDGETAKIAVQAALTGHLVLSTLHTNDSVNAVTRLYNLGVERYLVSASLVAALAQRLIRKMCGTCRKTAPAAAQDLHVIEKMGGSFKDIWRAPGCASCKKSGFAGRIGIFELLVPDDELRDAIAAGASLNELRRLAAAGQFSSLAQDGMAKVRDGLTTLQEIVRVVSQ